jgi:hypothetical protein
MIIYLVSAPGHEITGYGDGLIDGGHPSLLVSYLEYMGQKNKPLKGFRRSRLLDHPCAFFCERVRGSGLPENQACPRNCCYFDELGLTKAVLANEARVLQVCGEPNDVNSELLAGS